MSHRILLAVDGSDTSWRAVQEAIRFAQPTDFVRVVNVIDDAADHYSVSFSTYVDMGAIREDMIAESQQILSQAYKQVHEAGIQADTHAIDLRAWGGTIADAVVREALRWHADLIVLGTHGRRGVRRMLMGSVAEQVLRQAHLPIMLVAGVAAPAATEAATAPATMAKE